MSCGVVLARGFAFGEARYTKIVLFADTVSTFYSDLEEVVSVYKNKQCNILREELFKPIRLDLP